MKFEEARALKRVLAEIKKERSRMPITMEGGARARLKGKSLDDCPYNGRTDWDAWSRWRAGWHKMDKELTGF
jgi:ribosome modulation factor